MARKDKSKVSTGVRSASLKNEDGRGGREGPGRSGGESFTIVAALVQLSEEERLIAGLDPLTRRDLVAERPRGTEIMQQIGIAKTNLDGPVRSWINVSFRAPKEKDALTRGAIKPTTTWTQLLGLL